MTIYSTQKTSSMDAGSFYVYIVESSILITTCLAVAVPIFLNPRLRSQKEYIIFGGSAIFDALFGLAYLSAGAWRLAILYSETYVPLYTPWMCFNTFHIYIFTIIIPTSGVLTLLITLDRLFSVTFPIKYVRLTPIYSYSLLLVACLTSVPTFSLAAIGTYNNLRDNYTSSKVCTSSLAMSQTMFSVLRGIRITCTLMSVLFYIPIAWKVKSLLRRFKSQSTYGMSKKQQKQITAVTCTVALITLNQLVCFVIPDLILAFEIGHDSFVFYIMNLNKGILNMVIFVLTQRDLRISIFDSFTRRKTSERITKIPTQSALNFVYPRAPSLTRPPPPFRHQTAQARRENKSLTYRTTSSVH